MVCIGIHVVEILTIPIGAALQTTQVRPWYHFLDPLSSIKVVENETGGEHVFQ
jgi:hypothetical protein